MKRAGLCGSLALALAGRVHARLDRFQAPERARGILVAQRVDAWRTATNRLKEK